MHYLGAAHTVYLIPPMHWSHDSHMTHLVLLLVTSCQACEADEEVVVTVGVGIAVVATGRVTGLPKQVGTGELDAAAALNFCERILSSSVLQPWIARSSSKSTSSLQSLVES